LQEKGSELTITNTSTVDQRNHTCAKTENGYFDKCVATKMGKLKSVHDSDFYFFSFTITHLKPNRELNVHL